MTNAMSASAGPARFGGNLMVALDLGEAIIVTIMAAEDALLCGLIDEDTLSELDGALNGAPEGAASMALMDEDAYFDWLAEKWGYSDGDVRLDATTSHFGRS